MTHMRNHKTQRYIQTQMVKGVGSPEAQVTLFRPEHTDGWKTCLICLALFTIAMCFNLYQIGTPSVWFDESLSITRAHQPLLVLLPIISITQPNMALYYVLLNFWLGLLSFGGLHATEALVRFPSALLSALNTLILYFLARRFFGPLTAVFAALLYLLNPLQLTYAQEARSYALQLFFLIISWYAMCVLCASDLSPKHARLCWLCFILASTLAAYAQLFSELVLATQAGVFVLLSLIPNVWRARIRRQWRPLALSWICIGLLLLPILYASRVGAKTSWLPVPHLSDLGRILLELAAQNKFLLAFFLLTILVGLLMTLLVLFPKGQMLLNRLPPISDDERTVQDWHSRSLQFFPLALLLVCWLICPVAISYIVSQRTTHIFSIRYLVVIVPAFVLLVALGLASLRWRGVQLILGLCLLLLCLRGVSYYYKNAQVEDWRTGTQWLQRHYLRGDGLICFDNAQGCAVDIEYYLQTYPHGPAHFDADSPGYFPWLNYDLTNVLGDSQQALNTSVIQKYAARHPRLFFALGRTNINDPHVQAALRWLNTHYHLLAHKSTSTLTIYLYDTTLYVPHVPNLTDHTIPVPLTPIT